MECLVVTLIMMVMVALDFFFRGFISLAFRRLTLRIRTVFFVVFSHKSSLIKDQENEETHTLIKTTISFVKSLLCVHRSQRPACFFDETKSLPFIYRPVDFD